MSRKTLLVLLAAVMVLSFVGCRERGQVAREPNATDRDMGTDTGVARVPEGPGQPGEGIGQAQQQYIAGTEQMLSNIEQQAQNVAQAEVPEQDRQKVQQLQQELQQEISNARQALNKLRDAPPDAAADMKVVVDDAMANVQNTYRELQSVAGGRQVTQQPPQQ
jgi:hypothetical protein